MNELSDGERGLKPEVRSFLTALRAVRPETHRRYCEVAPRIRLESAVELTTMFGRDWLTSRDDLDPAARLLLSAFIHLWIAERKIRPLSTRVVKLTWIKVSRHQLF